MPFPRVSLAQIVIALISGSAAYTGECPAGTLEVPLPNAATAPVGVVDAELASIDLSKENVTLEQRRLLLRHMTIAPGGIVPLHRR